MYKIKFGVLSGYNPSQSPLRSSLTLGPYPVSNESPASADDLTMATLTFAS